VRCPSCSSETNVVETRSAEDGAAIRRRRRCGSCGRRFTTYERLEGARLYVRKRGGERQAFDPGKLRRALMRAAHKRPVSAKQVESIVAEAAARLEAAGGEAEASEIGQLCLARLRQLDLGAYLQFAGTLPEPAPELAASAAGSIRGVRDDAGSTREGRRKES
jgi:transcriptional repressor NrdR